VVCPLFTLLDSLFADIATIVAVLDCRQNPASITERLNRR
jgi:hypothetical protein